MKQTTRDIHQIAARFTRDGRCSEPVLYGDGHINDTYRFLARDEAGRNIRLVLQRINKTAFERPKEVMSNILLITDYLRREIEARGGDPMRETLCLQQTRDGQWYYEDENGDIWRVYLFVNDAISYNQTSDPAVFRAAGEAFGQFQRSLSDFDAAKLYETIKDFHHTPKRMDALKRAVALDKAGRVKNVREEIDFALSREAFASTLVDALERGELPLRVTHNDTKLNNVLVDEWTRGGLCVIDLDTVMPGLSAYDFGDAIRYGANEGAEDETDLSKVGLSMSMYRAYAEGYLGAAGEKLTKRELQSLPIGAKMMTLECGTRFLTDYLLGDPYFKIDYPEHNLARARSQYALLRDMERHWDEMTHVIDEWSAQLQGEDKS